MRSGRSVVRQIPDKRSIRSRLLAARAALSAETLAESSAAVTRHLIRLLADTPQARGEATIAAYVPFGAEPGGDLPELLTRLLPAATVLLPVVLADRDLDWAVYRGELATGSSATAAADTDAAIAADATAADNAEAARADDRPSAGAGPDARPPGRPGRRVSPLREPVGPRLGPDAIAQAVMIIVPALAVDSHGNRLGRGGGSYDRALARIAPGALTVALLHDGELLDELPAEEHDRRVRVAITPNGRHRTAI
jgi:5-formyltetrahydrofolate cyclo-ligase